MPELSRIKAWRRVALLYIAFFIGLFSVVMLMFIQNPFAIEWLILIESVLLGSALSVAYWMEKKLVLPKARMARTQKIRPTAEIAGKVFDYVRERGGSIVKEECLADLGITEDQFRDAIASLEKAEKLRPKKEGTS